MPFAKKPACSKCGSTESSMWRKGQEDQIFCRNCARSELDGIEDTAPAAETVEVPPKMSIKEAMSHFLGPLRKSSRLKPSKYKYQAPIKTLSTKGKGRRVIFKKNPIKAPPAVSTVITSNYLFHEGQYWQLGDIVSLLDEDGGVYYAQIRGFLQDQYCEKSVVITWLLPTLSSRPGKFDPATYIIGPEEDLPRPMSCFEFVMHAPSDYFYDKSSPYPTKPAAPELSYISTSLGQEIRPVPTQAQIFGLQDLDADPSAIPPEKVKAKQEGGRKRKQKERKSQKSGPKGNTRDKGNMNRGGGRFRSGPTEEGGGDDKASLAPLVIADKGSAAGKGAVKDNNSKGMVRERPAPIEMRRATRERNKNKKVIDVS